ncbi:protein DWD HYPERSENSITIVE TO UV-B 1-like [Amaranthus tricolor]|uniref:protein DWD HYPERSENSITIVE TO UV-B 1-like n=1 Tax=Amaranthus tricolor TaxID=29722 RepID=UPI00258AC0BE|nr:protein DWD HYPERSENSITIVE TO UV-B 1-like [Amaranthus tricolor]XP_057543687.1 protein DWD HYPERSENSITIVE TO UV-B 1-like [Amaranthus tricolor]XP_057543688.1 protein DWD HYPERSENSITIVE TO UV-B 1-like [Amaranthus tricolor]
MESLESRYLNCCKRQKVLPNPSILSSLSKTVHQKSLQSRSNLIVVLDHLKDADLLPLIDTINAMSSSDVDVVDILNESPCILNEDQVLSLMCAANQKLRTVSLQDLPFTKRFLRYLFRGGLCCQVLKLSSSSLQKLDMVGSFMHLRKLNLDFCTSLTTLHKDCFSHMPNLKHLSMCETRVANLWTTTVSLAKLPSLIELRFQNCLCCEETGPCPAYLSNKYGVHVSDITSPVGSDTCVDNQQSLSLRDFPSDSAFGLQQVFCEKCNVQDGCVNDLSESLSVLSTKKYISHHPAPICFEKHYREFMIASLPRLEVLDNLPIGKKDKKLAQVIYTTYFEYLPYNRPAEESVSRILQNREIASSGIPFRRLFKSKNSSDFQRKNQYVFSKSLCAAKLGASPWPLLQSLSSISCIENEESRRVRPRQFEYHPSDSSLMAFGTLDGEVVVINHENGKNIAYMPPMGARNSILGLCWLKKYPSKVLAGSDNGTLRLYDISNTSPKGAYSCYGGDFTTCDKFNQLTSVHINSTDELLLVSGYTRNVAMYDMVTGKRLQLFNDLHQEPINVAKFSHLSPNMFATSSFDHHVKMWDIRQKMDRPCYTATSSRGNVMVCFSPDDYYLLVSSIDNEVKQLMAVDGRLHTDFGISPSGSSYNYTRSYYMNERDYVISGSSDEQVVRICCAQTGRRLRDVYFEGRGSDKAMFVQSLRSDPFRPFNMSILASYAQSNSKCEIIKVNLLSTGEDDEEDSYLQHITPSFSLGG